MAQAPPDRVEEKAKHCEKEPILERRHKNRLEEEIYQEREENVQEREHKRAREGNPRAVQEQSELRRQNDNSNQLLFSARNNSDAVTLLADCAYQGDLEMVQDLLNQGVRASSRLRNARDEDRSVTPLHEAVRGKQADVCRVMCEADKYYVKNSDLLFYASRIGSVDVCKVLIQAGANENAKRALAGTPLHIAVECQSADVCKELIDAGADVNVKEMFGRTPLHIAVECQSADVCKFLIDAGADVNVKGMFGNTPLHTAASYGNLQIVQLLVGKCASLSVENKCGQTALQLAKLGNRESVVRYLEQRMNST